MNLLSKGVMSPIIDYGTCAISRTSRKARLSLSLLISSYSKFDSKTVFVIFKTNHVTFKSYHVTPKLAEIHIKFFLM